MLNRHLTRFLCFSFGVIFLTQTAMATNFAVLLSGGGGGDEDIACDAIEIGDLEFEQPTVVTAPDGSQYTRPGKFKPLRIMLKRGQISDAARRSIGLDSWIKEFDAGLRSERGISVFALKEKRPPTCEGCGSPWLGLAVARYTFPACEIDEIVEETSVLDDGSVAINQTLLLRTKKPPRIGSIASGGSAGKPILRVGIVGPNGGSVEQSLTSWSGGEPARVVSAPFLNTMYHEPSSDTVLLDFGLHNGGLPGMPAVYDWLNACITGDEAPRRVTINEYRPNGRPNGRSFIYHDCFPVRYVFPSFSGDAAASGGDEYMQVRGFKVEIAK